MNIEQQIVSRVRQLPINKQQEILDFAESLQSKETPQSKFASLKDLCAGLDSDLELAEFEKTRREVWTALDKDI